MRQPINGCYVYSQFQTHKRCLKLRHDQNDASITNALEDEA